MAAVISLSQGRINQDFWCAGEIGEE
jgi:hypothetical protein